MIELPRNPHAEDANDPPERNAVDDFFEEDESPEAVAELMKLPFSGMTAPPMTAAPTAVTYTRTLPLCARCGSGQITERRSE